MVSSAPVPGSRRASAALNMKVAPTACELLKAVELLKGMNERQARKVPDEAPTSFVRKRWESLVRTPEGLERRFYELCVLSELKNSLRSGDIWVQGSRQFKNFEDYLLPSSRFAAQRAQRKLGLAVETDCDLYLQSDARHYPTLTGLIGGRINVKHIRAIGMRSCA